MTTALCHRSPARSAHSVRRALGRVRNARWHSLGWEGFKWPDGMVTRTFAIITAEANEMIVKLHNRMPVILELDDWPTWLGEVEGDPAALVRPADDDVVKIWSVSKRVNSPMNNGAELLEAVGRWISTLPTRLTQTVKHVLEIGWSKPRSTLFCVPTERLRHQRYRRLQRVTCFLNTTKLAKTGGQPSVSERV
jgi:hypothetical protein